MRRILHILTKPEGESGNAFAKALIEGQRKRPGTEVDAEVRVVSLAVNEPAYGALVEELFEADSVSVW